MVVAPLFGTSFCPSGLGPESLPNWSLSRCQVRDREWVLIIPNNETRTGPYLVPGLCKDLGIIHWSRK